MNTAKEAVPNFELFSIYGTYRSISEHATDLSIDVFEILFDSVWDMHTNMESSGVLNEYL